MEKSFEVIITVRIGNAHAPYYTKFAGTRQASNNRLHFGLKHLYVAFVLKNLAGNLILYLQNGSNLVQE